MTEEQTPAPAGPSVMEPSKLLRIGTMVHELLNEARRAPLDEDARRHLKQIYDRSVAELREILSPELQAELASLTAPFASDEPTESELRIAQAQIVGWLEGLFHGIQASVFAQYAASQAQAEQFPRRALTQQDERGRGYL